MSEYTSTREGWQRTVEGMLNGPPSEAKHYVESIAVPSFYSTKDGVRLEYDAYISGIEKWRHKVTNWKPVVHEFLRDGDQLAARTTGTLNIGGTENWFEKFSFATIDATTGKMKSLSEMARGGPVGGESEQGAK